MSECITQCQIATYILHPFFGIIYIKNNKDPICVKRYYNFNSIVKICNVKESIFSDTLDCIVPIIDTIDYLKYYYKLHSLSEVVKYIDNNTNIKYNTLNRIFYYVLLKYNENLEKDIDKWSILTKLCIHRAFNININDDVNISNALKELINIYRSKLSYTINYLSIIKIILNDNI